MPFVKLDTGILDSSLWSEPAQTCKCWITLLAMADADGLVRSTAPGVARRANLGLMDTEKALAMFESPDAHSRSLNDDGKRIKRVDGGYQIVNYGKYREHDYTNAERQKRHRQRKRNTVTTVTRNGASRRVTYAEADADADKKRAGASGSRPTASFSVEDWLSELEKEDCYKGINVRAEYGKCRQWCIIHGKTLSKRRFVNWINRAEKPLQGSGIAKPTYKRNYMAPAREPTQEEIDKARSIARIEADKFRAEHGR